MALDLSLNSTGVCFKKIDSNYESFTIKSKKISDHMDKIIHLKRKIFHFIKMKEPDIVFVEGQSYGSRGRSTLSIAQLHGVIMYFLKVRKIKFVLIPPTTVKKFITGKGNSKKSLVMKSLYKKYRIDLDDEDEADATAVLITGCRS